MANTNSIIDVPGIQLHGDVEITLTAGYFFHFRQGEKANVRALFHSLEVDFQPTIRGAKLGEVLVELSHATT